jgi:predicted O-methyltransferase YrrM
MEIEKIRTIIDQHWQPGFGNISASEAKFIADLVKDARPETFVEVGVASGISTGLIALAMNEAGGKRLIGIDANPNFLKEPTGRKAGLIAVGCPNPVVEIRAPHMSIDVEEFLNGAKAEMAFIDGNHQHPWPLLDMIVLLPFMAESCWIVHHDLILYQRQEKPISIGPKYVFDQFNANERQLIDDGVGNIFALRLTGGPSAYEESLQAALLMPWTVTAPIPLRFLSGAYGVIKRFYSARFLQKLETSWSRLFQSRL